MVSILVQGAGLQDERRFADLAAHFALGPSSIWFLYPNLPGGASREIGKE